MSDRYLIFIRFEMNAGLCKLKVGLRLILRH